MDLIKSKSERVALAGSHQFKKIRYCRYCPSGGLTTSISPGPTTLASVGLKLGGLIIILLLLILCFLKGVRGETQKSLYN